MGLMPIHQKPNTDRPTKGHKTYPYLARAACVRTGQIRSGVWTSPICRCVAALGMASDRWRLMPRSPWWRSWTGTPAWSWRGGSRTSSHGPPLVRGPWRGDADFCVEALNEAIYRFGPPDIMTMEHGRAIGPSGHATSRVPVHVVCLDRPPATVGRPHLDGWQRRSQAHPGQHLHRAPVARPEIRMRLPTCLGDRITGTHRCPQLDGILQPPPAAQGSWRPTASNGLLTDSRSNATRSAGADQSLKSARSCQRNGERLSEGEFRARFQPACFWRSHDCAWS